MTYSDSPGVDGQENEQSGDESNKRRNTRAIGTLLIALACMSSIGTPSVVQEATSGAEITGALFALALLWGGGLYLFFKGGGKTV